MMPGKAHIDLILDYLEHKVWENNLAEKKNISLLN